jgi:hypothetical protein
MCSMRIEQELISLKSVFLCLVLDLHLVFKNSQFVSNKSSFSLMKACFLTILF